MKILLTGATGYIAKRLIPVLLAEGHEVICCVRDRNRFDPGRYRSPSIDVIELDFLDRPSLKAISEDIDAAYYLIHSMSTSVGNFEELEKISATNFRERMDETGVKQVIYLSGIINNRELSRHLTSRKAVEEILSEGQFPLTTLRAGIILGSGSASFEIIRDLVEKLPVMVAPNWLNTRSQPIAIRNVLQYLSGSLLNEQTFGRSFDIGGPEILTYKEMLLQFASVRGLKRHIFVVPVMTPRLSSYWLYFITSTSYKLAVNLVKSMKVEIVCGENNLNKIMNFRLLTYREAVSNAFDSLAQEEIDSSWTDALSSHTLEDGIVNHIEVPTYGCFRDEKVKPVSDASGVMQKIWTIGGETGWYYATWLWVLRGFLDKLVGGVGLRRGRKSKHHIKAGDSLDFWRVLYASREEKRLLLYAEMKLPGEAWLEFRVENNKFYQTATFRPLGLWGRIYWYLALPLHAVLFSGMSKRIST